MSRFLPELSGPAAARRMSQSSIVVVGTGAIEHHGPHLPLLTDFLLADTIVIAAVEAAAQAGLDVWRLPTLAYTKSDEHAWAPGTVWLDWDTMFRTCLEIGRSVATLGAGSLVFANGHGGNVALLGVVIREIRRRYGLKTFATPVLSVSPDVLPPGGSLPDDHDISIHGSASETSLVMHLRPELVDLSLAERWIPDHLRDFQRIGFNGRPVAFGWLSDDFGTPGVIGDPTQATAAYGAALWNAALAQMLASFEEIARFSHRPPVRA